MITKLLCTYKLRNLRDHDLGAGADDCEAPPAGFLGLEGKRGAQWCQGALFGAAPRPRLNAPKHHKPHAPHGVGQATGAPWLAESASRARWTDSTLRAS